MTAKRKTVALGVTVNIEQELYVVPCYGGHTCLGFGVVLARIKALEDWLRDKQPVTPTTPLERGSLATYWYYRAVLDHANAYCRIHAIRCPVELTTQLIGLEGKRVEIVDKYGEKRRFIVGKSTGWLPIHLEIARRDSSGGPAVTGAPFRTLRVMR